MAARKKAAKAKKAVAKRTGAGGARRPLSKRQALRRGVQRKIDASLSRAMKLARALEAQGLAPDEISARVKADLEGLGSDVTADVLRLAGGSIHVNMEP